MIKLSVFVTKEQYEYLKRFENKQQAIRDMIDYFRKYNIHPSILDKPVVEALKIILSISKKRDENEKGR